MAVEEEYEGGPDRLEEKMAGLDEELAESRAAALRASLADYDLDDEDADLLAGLGAGVVADLEHLPGGTERLRDIDAAAPPRLVAAATTLGNGHVHPRIGPIDPLHHAIHLHQRFRISTPSAIRISAWGGTSPSTVISLSPIVRRKMLKAPAALMPLCTLFFAASGSMNTEIAARPSENTTW